MEQSMNNNIKAGIVALSTIGFILLNKTTREFVTGLVKNCKLLKKVNDDRKFKPEQISFC